MARGTIGPALAEAEALGFFEITEHGKMTRAAEYRRPNLFLLTTRPELEGVGPERCRWRRFKSLEEAQAVADAARAKAVIGRKAKRNGNRYANLKAAGAEGESITVQKVNRSSAFIGAKSEPPHGAESEPLSISREGRAKGVTGARSVAEQPSEAEIEAQRVLSRPGGPNFAISALSDRRPQAMSGRMPADEAGLIDLTGDAECEALLVRRSALKEIERAGAEACRERQELDDQIAAKMGNAPAELAGEVTVASVTVRRKGYVVEPYQYRQIRVLKRRLVAVRKRRRAISALKGSGE
jgi:hypothetical protein